MGSVVSKRTPATGSPQYPPDSVFLVLQNELIVNKILKAALQRAIPEDARKDWLLSAKEGCKLRLVCHLWNREVCSIFLFHRQPLLRFHTVPTKLMKAPSECLPPFRLCLERKKRGRVWEALPFSEEKQSRVLTQVVDIILIRLNGSSTLLELSMYNLPEMQQALLDDTVPRLTSSLKFPVLQKLVIHLPFLTVEQADASGNSVTSSSWVAQFICHVLENSPELQELDWQTQGWFPTPGPLYPVLEPAGLNSRSVRQPLDKLTILNFYNGQEQRLSEECLLQILNRCSRSLKLLRLTCDNPREEAAQQLDLEPWPKMENLEKVKLTGKLAMDDPRDFLTPRRIKDKFPRLEQLRVRPLPTRTPNRLVAAVNLLFTRYRIVVQMFATILYIVSLINRGALNCECNPEAGMLANLDYFLKYVEHVPTLWIVLDVWFPSRNQKLAYLLVFILAKHFFCWFWWGLAF